MDRANRGGGVATPIEQGIIQRMRDAFQYVATGRNEWFGPSQPMPPVAPPEVAGRQLDYQTGYNQNLSPRALEPVGFSHLRTLADSYDLMRLVIETRKDQVSRMQWTIKPRDIGVKTDARSQKIAEFLRMPDREHDWDVWLRALIEDMLVIDAATIYPRKTRGGDVFALELIDGATIKRVIDESGRTPVEGPAYQQVLKGVVAGNFTRDEIIYRMRNWRTHRIYGFSPVEQVIMTVNIALRRQVHQLQFYSEGNVPEALIGVPETWGTEQIRQFQEYWDSLMEGNTAKRRHAKFVPGGMEYIPTKEAALKDMYDEWLARIICFAFSVSPNALISQINRATAEVSVAQAMQEGLAPIMAWVKSTMDIVVAQVFNAPDLEFDWVEEINIDPEVKSRIHVAYVGAGVMSVDEVREELGMDAAGDAVPDNPVVEEQKGEYLGSLMKRRATRPKSASPIAPVNRERRAVKKAQAKIRSAIDTAFADCLDEAIKATGEIGKAATEGERIAAGLRLAGLDALAEALADIFVELMRDAGAQALTQISVDDPKIVEQVNDLAVEWARNHAAELVGKKWVDGVLMDNPNATYRIDIVTREGVRSLVDEAISNGWSNQRLAEALRQSYAFSAERAELIATTETAYADIEGNMIAYRESGVVVGKRWLIGNQPVVCDICAANAAQGVIELNKEFESGRLAPPQHPRCRCDIRPITRNRSRAKA